MTWQHASEVVLDGIVIPVLRTREVPGSPSLIFAHGLKDRWDSWRPIADRFSGRFTTYALQLPWASDGDHRWMDSGCAERWLGAAVEAVPGPRVLVAHSIASAAVLRLLSGGRRHGVAAAVLVAPLFIPPAEWDNYLVGDQCASDLAESTRRFLHERFVRRAPHLGADVVDTIADRLIEKTDWPLMRRLLVANADSTALDLDTVDVPIAVLAPDHDPMRERGWFAALTASLRGADEVSLPGCGHLCHLEAPELVVDAISRFLDRHPQTLARTEE